LHLLSDIKQRFIRRPEGPLRISIPAEPPFVMSFAEICTGRSFFVNLFSAARDRRALDHLRSKMVRAEASCWNASEFLPNCPIVKNFIVLDLLLLHHHFEGNFYFLMISSESWSVFRFWRQKTEHGELAM
jgi:hypothetical protein